MAVRAVLEPPLQFPVFRIKQGPDWKAWGTEAKAPLWWKGGPWPGVLVGWRRPGPGRRP